MIASFLTILLLIAGSLYWISAGLGITGIYREEARPPGPLHLYNNAAQPIADIKISAFYFVPKNKTASQISNWSELLDKNLKKLQEFHILQFQDRSNIHYEIYPESIIGRHDNRTYDTDITQHGNPEALRRVAVELEERVLASSGDKFRTDFGHKEENTYHVLLILYEGVGASGSENVAMVSRTFLASPQYAPIAASILAHEFYHTLGIPDFYELPLARPTSQDLMGLGRERLIEKTYIERETLRQLGL